MSRIELELGKLEGKFSLQVAVKLQLSGVIPDQLDLSGVLPWLSHRTKGEQNAKSNTSSWL